jgi:hypothetical protein
MPFITNPRSPSRVNPLGHLQSGILYRIKRKRDQ